MDEIKKVISAIWSVLVFAFLLLIAFLGVMIIILAFVAWPNWILFIFYLAAGGICLYLSHIWAPIPFLIGILIDTINLLKYQSTLDHIPETVLLKNIFLRQEKGSLIVDNAVKIKETGDTIFLFQDLKVEFSLKAKFYLLKCLIQDIPKQYKRNYKITSITKVIGGGSAIPTLRGFTQGLNGNYVANYDYSDYDEIPICYQLSYGEPAKPSIKKKII